MSDALTGDAFFMQFTEQFNMQLDTKLEIEFAEAACLNKEHSPWCQRREPGEYGMFEIVDAKGYEWWTPFIGIRFMGRIRRWRNMPDEAIVCRLTNTKIHTGRSIDLSCLTLI